MLESNSDPTDLSSSNGHTNGILDTPSSTASETHLNGTAARRNGFFRRRRSRSADELAALRKQRQRLRRRRRPLIDDHFRVDRIGEDRPRRVILPGVNRYDPDWARDSHDFFNLVVLVPVVVLNLMNWNFDVLFGDKRYTSTSAFLAAAWTSEWFGWFFGVTVAYFLVDLLWILTIPECVKSPATIIQHHLATILYILIPYRKSDYRWCMGACMIVEVNTWFLIARRVFNKQGFPPWIIDLSFVSIRVKLISILFYTTWIAIRCVLYPYLMLPFWEAWSIETAKYGTRWNLIALCVPLHACFCLLNLKWSYDLLMSKIRYWRRKGNYQAVSKGL